jgi:mannose-6-phosphate isomerase-like protein (cupin superfamily)
MEPKTEQRPASSVVEEFGLTDCKEGRAMKSEQLTFRPGFRVSIGNGRSQAAVMVLAAGGKEGGADNRHQGADQWLLVVEGSGAAIINGRKMTLKPGKILLIEAGDRHEIRNTGRTLLKTVSVYVPPAYRDEENELPAGRSH